MYGFEREVDKSGGSAQRECKAGRVALSPEDTKQIWNTEMSR